MEARDLETERTTARRRPERVSHDCAAVYAILDAAPCCHVGFVADGQPYVIPTIHARVDDRLYLHGSAASRTLRVLASGVPVCVTATLVDGLVLARSAFHHSMNYRSVVVLGTAFELTDDAARSAALAAIVERLVPGRWSHVRAPSAAELRATRVLALPIVEASAKVRRGGPIEDDADLGVPVWAGELPLRLLPGEPIPDARLDRGAVVPEHVRRLDARRF